MYTSNRLCAEKTYSKRLVYNESLGIQMGKVHQRIRSGTGLLRNQVDGVVGEKADTETLPISSRK